MSSCVWPTVIIEICTSWTKPSVMRKPKKPMIQRLLLSEALSSYGTQRAQPILVARQIMYILGELQADRLNGK
eukprot:197144-Pleurochrysis_carterae.AAC.1